MGTDAAPRTVEQGAAIAVKLATMDNPPTGKSSTTAARFAGSRFEIQSMREPEDGAIAGVEARALGGDGQVKISQMADAAVRARQEQDAKL